MYGSGEEFSGTWFLVVVFAGLNGEEGIGEERED